MPDPQARLFRGTLGPVHHLCGQGGVPRASGLVFKTASSIPPVQGRTGSPKGSLTSSRTTAGPARSGGELGMNTVLPICQTSAPRLDDARKRTHSKRLANASRSPSSFSRAWRPVSRCCSVVPAQVPDKRRRREVRDGDKDGRPTSTAVRRQA